MKTRKNLMILVLLSLFLSVGVADNNISLPNDELPNDELPNDVDRISSYLKEQGYKVTDTHISNLSNQTLTLDKVILELKGIKLTQKDKDAINKILATTGDSELDEMFADLDKIEAETAKHKAETEQNYADAEIYDRLSNAIDKALGK